MIQYGVGYFSMPLNFDIGVEAPLEKS